MSRPLERSATALTLSDLQRLLALPERYPEEVVVSIIVREPCFGPTPTVPVTGAGRGIDWDKGKLLLMPAEPLYRAEKIHAETLAQISVILAEKLPMREKIYRISNLLRHLAQAGNIS